MEPLKIATVQFETRDNDKVYNLSIIREMCRKASVEGADVVAFHECSVCGYTFAKDLSREELLAIAEPIPTGESTQALIVSKVSNTSLFIMINWLTPLIITAYFKATKSIQPQRRLRPVTAPMSIIIIRY